MDCFFPFFGNGKNNSANHTSRDLRTTLPGQSILPSNKLSRKLTGDPTAESLRANHTPAATVVLIKAADALEFALKAKESSLGEWEPPITVKRFSGGMAIPPPLRSVAVESANLLENKVQSVHTPRPPTLLENCME